MLKLQINIPLYSFKCSVIIADEIEKVIAKYLKRFKIPLTEENGEYDGYALFTPQSKYYIFYSLHSLTPNTIVHEVSHIVDYMVEDKGIEKTGEARSYLTGYISEKIFDFILKNKLLISPYLEYKQVHMAE